jgi:hypothetical protein
MPKRLSMFSDDETGETRGSWFYKGLEVLVMFLDVRLVGERCHDGRLQCRTSAESPDDG